MDVFYWLFFLVFVLVCIADVYLDVAYRGLGAWVLSRVPFSDQLPRGGGVFRVAAPIVGLVLIVGALLLLWLVTRWVSGRGHS